MTKPRIKNWTPLFDVVIQKDGLDVVSAAILGRVWRYEQGEMKKCTASQSTIAEDLGLSRQTVNKHLQVLCSPEVGLLQLIEGPEGSTNEYRTTGRLDLEFSIEAVDYDDGGVSTEQTPHVKSADIKKESNKQGKKKEKDSVLLPILEKWAELFPDKPQPRPTTKSYQNKARTRMKDPEFAEKWEEAMLRASQSPTYQSESWFDLEYFLRNDENWLKCYNRKMAWKDSQYAGKTSAEHKDHARSIERYMQGSE